MNTTPPSGGNVGMLSFSNVDQEEAKQIDDMANMLIQVSQPFENYQLAMNALTYALAKIMVVEGLESEKMIHLINVALKKQVEIFKQQAVLVRRPNGN